MASAKELAKELDRAWVKAAQLRQARDEAIVREYRAGRRPVDLARETGLTRGRIAQLTKEQ
jgi:hypothetical protein